MPKAAVIMPAYNAERYIEAAVRSVLCQSFGDLELIAVDDGSTDGTAAILSRLAGEDRRLRLIRVKNAGPAAARNRGIEALRPGTEFALFMDADDELPPGALVYALRGAQSGAELTVLGFTVLSADGRESRYSEPEQFLTGADMAEAFPRLYKANLLNQAWGKVFRTELLTGPGAPRFPDCRWGEDRLFIFDCLERARRVHVLPGCGYRYIMRPGESLVSRYYDKKFSVCLRLDERAEALGKLFGVADQAALRYMFSKSVFSCLTGLFAPSCPLDRASLRAAAEEILDNARVKRRCRDTRGGLPTEALCAVLQSGSVGLNLLAFHAVALAGELAPGLFIKLKHRK